MSYKKGGELLKLAIDIAARRYGMTYSEIDDYSKTGNLEARRRNTQRMVKKLEEVFGPAVETVDSSEGKRVFINGSKSLELLQNISRNELAAFRHAIQLLNANNHNYDAEQLDGLYNKIMATTRKNFKKSTLIDFDYLIESNYVAATPGPHVEINDEVVGDIYDALTAGNQIEFEYFDPSKDIWVSRHVHPQGLIIGRRHYLIAISDKALQFQSPVWYRLDRIRHIKELQAAAQKIDNFNLADYAKRAFGGFYSDEEYSEIEWRFASEAARAVKNFRFHPDQITRENEDGSITISFKAAGYYEMAWALYPWGTRVEVIKPQALRDLVNQYRRDDFPMLP